MVSRFLELKEVVLFWLKSVGAVINSRRIILRDNYASINKTAGIARNTKL